MPTMVAAIRQTVTVQQGGVVQVSSPELTEGARAEVIVLVEAQTQNPAGAWRRHAGAINSSDPSSADNDRIDADLAREASNGAGGR
jgi:hypothetical protein